LIVVDDLGCGALLDLSRIGLPKEPTVQDSLGAGADVALFSGDKLIGGPQAGIIVGKKDLIARIRRHPLARALRVGKFTIAALEATLKLFLDPDSLIERNPTLRMLALRPEQLRPRAEALTKRLASLIDCEATDGQSACGGGALPDTPLATVVVALKPKEMSASDLARRLRLGEPSVVARVQDDTVQLDVRTLMDGDEERIETALRKAMSME
jgi:L-seryl-tRNA(Ser) seleniumtransferase